MSGLLVAAVCVLPSVVAAQTLIGSRSFVGSAEVYVVRPAAGSVLREARDVQVTTAPFSALFAIAGDGAGPIAATYGLLEMGRSPATIGWLRRGPGQAGGLLPRSMVAAAQAGPAGTTVVAYGSLSGMDASGVFLGMVMLQLQEVIVQPPPVTPQYPFLPSFDGVTLRVPEAWQIRKFEGFAQRLAAKYGTLPGGTTATVPASWRDGVMQCHSTNGFVYEIPLTLSYQGFVNGSILYVSDGVWPSWEVPAYWQAIATGPGHTKFVYRPPAVP
jgi:hypothetical protein